MVELDLLQTVAIDLGIERYSVETDAQFNNRVIYSAMACWIKAACQDLPVGGEHSEGVSRRHIHDKCSRILSSFLCRYHSSEPWFVVEEANNDAVSILRSRLLRHQELNNVGFNTSVALAATSNTCLSGGLEVIHGMLFLAGAKYNGIALTKQSAQLDASPRLDVSPVGEWFDSYIKTAWWEPFDASREECLEYFNARRKTSNMHYWNQRVHSLLDRFAALELLDWCEDSILPEELSYEQQDKLLAPLNALGADFSVIGDGKKHYIQQNGSKRRIYAYPAMWSEFSDLLPEDAISLSDKMLKYALPQADAKIRSLI